MSKAVEIIDGVLFVHTRHYDDVNRVIICHQKKPYRVFSDDEKKELSRPHGEWLRKNNSNSWFECSVCKEVSDVVTIMREPTWKFCPNCGADMRKLQANGKQVTGKLDENTQKHYGFRKKY